MNIEPKYTLILKNKGLRYAFKSTLSFQAIDEYTMKFRNPCHLLENILFLPDHFRIDPPLDYILKEFKDFEDLSFSIICQKDHQVSSHPILYKSDKFFIETGNIIQNELKTNPQFVKDVILTDENLDRLKNNPNLQIILLELSGSTPNLKTANIKAAIHQITQELYHNSENDKIYDWDACRNRYFRALQHVSRHSINHLVDIEETPKTLIKKADSSNVSSAI